MTTKKRISDTKKNAETQMNNQRAMIKRLCLSSSVIGLFSMTLLHAMPAFADCATPASPEGGLAYFTADDTYRYCDSTDTWVVIATSGGSSLWTDNTTHITRTNFHILNAGLAAGSTTAGLDGDGVYTFYDPDKGALRGGEVAFGETGWEDANIGTDSFAWGRAPRASGLAAAAFGDRTRATGESSFAAGYDSYATDNQAIAMGDTARATAYGSIALGQEVQATGINTMVIGLADQTSVGDNQVSGVGSMGIFMDDVGTYNLSDTDMFAVVGGQIMIDEDATSAASRGCIRYNDTTDKLQYSHDCTTYADMGGSSVALSGISAATAANTIANGVHLQTWNWALTGATEDAFTFGETTAATNGAGGQSVLKATTLASSTAIPFMITNLGNGLSMRVNDETGDADTTPFVIGASGNVGVGTTTTTYDVTFNGTAAHTIGMIPNTTSNTAGNSLTVRAGDATSGATDKDGGTLVLAPGQSTGVGYSTIQFQSATPWGGGGNTATNSLVDVMRIFHDGSQGTILHLQAPTAYPSNKIWFDGIGETALTKGDTYPGVSVIRFNLSAHPIFHNYHTAAPADGDFDNSEWTMWFDETNDEFELKGKKSDGTVMTATVGGGGSSLWTDNTTHISRAGVHVLNAAETSDSTDMSIAGGGAAGKRMFFDMTKGSIRGGELGAANDAWDNANISPNSFAWGLNAEASGDSILAIGSNVTASSGGTAIGGDITASQYSIAIGGPIDSYGLGAVAIGNNLESGGNSSVAIGSYVYSTGGASIGMGLSIGSHATGSVALGQNLYVANTGAGSVALGQDTEVSGANSMALGLGAAATAPVVSGANSFGVFMGDQSGIDVAAASTMAVLGGDFIVGSYQLDDTATGSQDSRMFFDRSKGAFRVGEVAGTQWDDASVGTHSVAMGLGTSASGAESFAVGLDSVANNSVSFAAGQLVTASGYNSIAHGQEATASGGNSVVFGLGDATGAYPIVSGASSFGVFMGDQSGVDLSQTNTMALMGGRLGIGTVTPSVELEVTGDIEYTGTITDVSDRRLKDNIRPLDEHGSMLDKLASVDTYSFTMKDDKAGRAEFGVMAQELEGIFPELVRTAQDEMGTKSVNYVGLIAPMIEATKELKAENDVLKSQMDDLSQQVALLNKVTAQNVNKASMSGYVMMLVGLALGFGVALILQRRTKQS